jgi:hypothetical protein
MIQPTEDAMAGLDTRQAKIGVGEDIFRQFHDALQARGLAPAFPEFSVDNGFLIKVMLLESLCATVEPVGICKWTDSWTDILHPSCQGPDFHVFHHIWDR